jgi:hypothetical protein
MQKSSNLSQLADCSGLARRVSAPKVTVYSLLCFAGWLSASASCEVYVNCTSHKSGENGPQSVVLCKVHSDNQPTKHANFYYLLISAISWTTNFMDNQLAKHLYPVECMVCNIHMAIASHYHSQLRIVCLLSYAYTIKSCRTIVIAVTSQRVTSDTSHKLFQC